MSDIIHKQCCLCRFIINYFLPAILSTLKSTLHVVAISSFDNVGCTKNIKLVSPSSLALAKRVLGLKPVLSKAFSKYTSEQLP